MDKSRIKSEISDCICSFVAGTGLKIDPVDLNEKANKYTDKILLLFQAENEQMRKDGHNPSWRATHDRCLELIGDNRQLREENEKLKVELDDREIRRAEAIFRRVTAENEALKEVK